MERTKEAIQELAEKTGAEIIYKGSRSRGYGKAYEITIKTEKYLNLSGLLIKKGLVKTTNFWSTDVEIDAVKFLFTINKNGGVECWTIEPLMKDNEGKPTLIRYNGELDFLMGKYSLEEVADYIKKQAIIIPKYFNEYRKLTPKKHTVRYKWKDGECPEQESIEGVVSHIIFE